MANDILMLIELNTDTIARLSLILSVVAVVVSIAALFAVFYSRRATPKNDPEEVEEEAPRLDQVSNKSSGSDTQAQPEEARESSQSQAQPVSVSVEGESIGEVPLELLITLQDPSVRVSRVERISEAGKSLGSSPCKATGDALVFKSILAPEKVRQWWDEAESVSDGEARSLIRVHLLPDGSGKEVSRDVPVSIVEGLKNVGIATLVVWTIKGST
jgi:hypothetical protein